MRSLHAAENVVKAGGPSLPKPSLRELCRQQSDSADPRAAAAERNDVWKRAAAQRKKLISLGLVKEPTKLAGYQDLLKKTPEGKFVGRAGEEHRLIVCSADLVSQGGPEPWSTPSAPDEKTFDAMLKFMLGCRGVADVIAALDGCMRPARRTLEDGLFSQLTSMSEVFIVYSASWNAWVKRKTFLGSENCEVGYVAMPQSRAKCPVKQQVVV